MAIIGIDLGTTNSACSVWQDGDSVLIPNKAGSYLTPSVVGVDDNKHLMCGQAALDRLVSHPSMTIAAFKRWMGTDRTISLDQKVLSAVELSSLILQSLKEDAEAFLDEEITEAIISVPAYFNDLQRKATKMAAEIAGLKVERLINEPTAAALKYGLQNQEEGAQYLILDLGGGTFDVSLVEYFSGVIEVHASAGDNYLGGEDFTKALIQRFCEDQKIETATLKQADEAALWGAMERAKRALTSEQQISVEAVIPSQTSVWTLSRDQFASLVEPLIQRMRLPIERAVLDAGLNPNDIDEVILVGGATRMQPIRTLVTRMFKRLPLCNIDPDLVVALGAGIQAGLKAKSCDLDDVVLTDVCPYTLGTAVQNQNDTTGEQGGLFLPIIERNTTVPTSFERSVVTANDNQTTVKVEIYQGESRLIKNNILLGTIELDVPPRPAGAVSIYIRYTYDMNGLLDVDVHVPMTNKRYSTQIMNLTTDLSPEVLAKSKEKMAKLKIHPRDVPENKELLQRAENAYESLLGYDRDEVADLIERFEKALEAQRSLEIIRTRTNLTDRLNRLDDDRRL
jgi:molecular chaperone HscC